MAGLDALGPGGSHSVGQERTTDSQKESFMETNPEQIYRPSSYRIAYEDIELLKRQELRPVRLQLELLKPELIMEEHKILSAIVVFGSARLLW